LDLSSRS